MQVSLSEAFASEGNPAITLVFSDGETVWSEPVEAVGAAILMYKEGLGSFRSHITQVFVENETDLIVVTEVGEGNLPNLKHNFYISQIDSDFFLDQEGVGNEEVIDYQVTVNEE